MARCPFMFDRGFIYHERTRIGNIKNGFIFEGNSSCLGIGRRIGNVKNGFIFEGNSSCLGIGRRIGHVKNGIVFAGNSSCLGIGHKVCPVDAITIPGIEREADAMIAAVFHFLIKDILS